MTAKSEVLQTLQTGVMELLSCYPDGLKFRDIKSLLEVESAALAEAIQLLVRLRRVRALKVHGEHSSYVLTTEGNVALTAVKPRVAEKRPPPNLMASSTDFKFSSLGMGSTRPGCDDFTKIKSVEFGVAKDWTPGVLCGLAGITNKEDQ